MRHLLLLSTLALAAASPLAAQFEGTVTMRMSSQSASGNGPGDMTLQIAVKGGRSATTMTMPASAGPMAGMEMRAIFDPATNIMTSLVPLPPGMAAMPAMANAKGIKIVMDLSKAATGARGSADPSLDVKKLGTSERIAGLSCDDYELTTANNPPTRMCVTTALGRFVLPSANGMGRGAAPPAWSRAFGDQAVFPLKVWTTDGKMAMEVTAIAKGTVPPTAFEIPDGYMDMSALGGRRPPV